MRPRRRCGSARRSPSGSRRGRGSPMAEPRGVRVIDSTLRDGSHAKAHQFTADQVAAIAGGLDRAGVGTVEVSHGDGLGGSSLQYGRSLEPQAKLLEAARQAMPNARLAVLLLAGYGTQCVYVVDSAGAMTPDDARRRVAALRDALDPQVEVGIHAHNNLGSAIGNSLAAITEGAGCVDGCACGLGAGAGNTQTEVLVAALDKLGIHTGIDVLGVMDVAEDLVKPIMDRPQTIDRASLVLGYAGVYSSFLLHAERAARRFGVPVRDILLECGRLRTVGGQEDMIVDIAAQLAGRRQPEAAS